MSKLDYSRYIAHIMKDKIGSINSGNIDFLLKDNDKLYVLALSIAYLTLSKEKIIEKDKNNTDKLGRLTKHIKVSDLDTIFEPSFSSKMPLILEADSTDNLWILDNFRDSIMHGEFEMDLAGEVLLINNTGYDRRLKAEIPF